MKRIVTAILSATEAFAIATAGLAIIAIPALLVWLVTYGLAGDPGFVFGLSVALWFFGHAVPLEVTVDAATAAGFGLPAEQITAMFSLFPLGFMLFTAGFAARSGWRLAAHQLSVAAWGAAAGIATYFILSWVLSGVAPRPPIALGVFVSAVLPTLVFTIGLALGFLAHSLREEAPWVSSLRHLLSARITQTWEWVLASASLGARIAGYALTAMAASAALVFALRLGFNYVDVVSLSQQLHVDGLGSLMLFFVNLAYLPTILIWVLSWIIGPGFSLGVGSSVSVLSTQLGPIPNLPILGALPTGSNPWALAVINLVLISAVLATMGVLRRHHREGGQKPTLREFSVTVVVGTVVAALLVVLAMWLATGAMGPGRLEQVGPHPWLVGGVAAIELLVGCALGAWLSYVDWDRVVDVAKDKTQGIRSSRPIEAVGAVTQKLKRRTRPVASEREAETHSLEGQTQSVSQLDAQLHPDEHDTAVIEDFTPWWGEKDDTI